MSMLAIHTLVVPLQHRLCRAETGGRQDAPATDEPRSCCHDKGRLAKSSCFRPKGLGNLEGVITRQEGVSDLRHGLAGQLIVRLDDLLDSSADARSLQGPGLIGRKFRDAFAVVIALSPTHHVRIHLGHSVTWPA